ncbi:hypothetical protein HU200_028352 [Digitaria exilis]|uniref:Uncharacterized protein n=1 Tax=Digitaria exilis TaxID=1010633 RepID=A0A835EPT0_9POAL|nr:hypothetical protein HU200_028352 [Digitaria exilis]
MSRFERPRRWQEEEDESSEDDVQLMIDCDGMSYVTFEAGAMPSLWMLSLGIDPDEWDKDTAIPDGLQHLSGLKEICVLEANTVGPDRRKDNTSTMERIKGAFQEAAGVHPND